MWLVNVVDGTGTPERRPSRYDASKGKKVFGIEYRTMEETAKDMADDFKTRGWGRAKNVRRKL